MTWGDAQRLSRRPKRSPRGTAQHLSRVLLARLVGFWPGVFYVIAVSPVVAVALWVAARLLRSKQRDQWFWFVLQRTGAPPDLERLRAAAVGFAGQLRGHVAVVVTRRPEGAVSYLGFEHADDARLASRFAGAVGANAAQSQAPLLLAGVTVRAKIRERPFAGASTNLTETDTAAKSVAAALDNPGEFVALIARAQTRREQERIHIWYDGIETVSPNIRTHPAVSKGGMVCTIWAGGSDKQHAEMLPGSLTEHLAGFDIATAAKHPKNTQMRARIGTFGLPPVAVAAAGAALTGGPVAAVAAAGAAAILAGQIILVAVGNRIGPAAESEALQQSTPPTIAPRRGGRRSHTEGTRWYSGDRIVAATNPYPLADHVFPVGAQHVALTAAPHAGAASGAATTASREPAALLTQTAGVLIGKSGPNGRDVYIPNEPAAPRAIGMIGAPGMGKSGAAFSVYAADILRAAAGEHMSLIDFESKSGSSAAFLAQIARNCGLEDRLVVIDVHDPRTTAIDMFPGNASYTDKAKVFLDGYFDARGEREWPVTIGVMLQDLIAAGLAVSDNIATFAGIRPASMMTYAAILAGALYPGKDMVLFRALTAAAKTAEETAGGSLDEMRSGQARTALGAAVVPLIRYFGDGDTVIVTDKTRGQTFQYVAHRLKELVELEAWFAPARHRRSWADLLASESIVIVSHGSPIEKDVVPCSEREVNRLMGVALHGLRSAIRVVCDGWQEQQRWVPIIIDELAIFADCSAELPMWLRDAGRSFGVRPTLATQAVRQLSEEMVGCLMGFPTMLFFQQGDDPRAVEAAVARLDLAEPGAWPDVLKNLPPFQVLLSTWIAGQRQPICLVELLNGPATPLDELRRRQTPVRR